MAEKEKTELKKDFNTQELIEVKMKAEKNYSFYNASKTKIYDIPNKLAEFKKDVYNSCDELFFVKNTEKDYTELIDYFIGLYSEKLEKKYKRL